jgi:hypothetical protein
MMGIKMKAMIIIDSFELLSYNFRYTSSSIIIAFFMEQEKKTSSPLSGERLNEWSQKAYVKISQYCQTKNHFVTGVYSSRCQSLAPVLSVFCLKTQKKSVDLWGITGEFATDIAHYHVAKNARDVLRYFSMAWQLESAKLEANLERNTPLFSSKSVQEKYIQQLTAQAEGLYAIYNNDALWKNSGL